MELAGVPSGRDHVGGSHRKSHEDGCAAIGACRAIDDEGFTSGEPAADQTAIGKDEAANGSKLRRLHVLEAIGEDNRRSWQQGIFSKRSVRPIRLHLLAVGTERRYADQNLRGISDVLR